MCQAISVDLNRQWRLSVCNVIRGIGGPKTRNAWLCMFENQNHMLNPLSPHDASKHHFTSLKTYLIFLKLRVLERKFP